MIQHKPVHLRRKSVKACAGIAQHRFRGFEFLTGLQGTVEIGGRNALHDPREALLGQLGRTVMITRIDQIKAIDLARILGCLRFTEQKTGVMLIGGCSGAAFVDHAAGSHGCVAALHFRSPAAVKGGHGEAAGNVHGKAHELMEFDRLFTRIFQHRKAGHGGIVQREVQLQPRASLLHDDLQCFTLAVGLGQAAFHGGHCFQHAIVYITKVRGLSIHL